MEFIIENKEWIFSGIGVAIISYFLIKRSGNKTISKNSTGIITDGDVKIKIKGKNSSEEQKDK